MRLFIPPPPHLISGAAVVTKKKLFNGTLAINYYANNDGSFREVYFICGLDWYSVFILLSLSLMGPVFGYIPVIKWDRGGRTMIPAVFL
jgi:hypothetical protein